MVYTNYEKTFNVASKYAVENILYQGITVYVHRVCLKIIIFCGLLWFFPVTLQMLQIKVVENHISYRTFCECMRAVRKITFPHYKNTRKMIEKFPVTLPLVRLFNRIFLLQNGSLLQCKKSACRPAYGRVFFNRFLLRVLLYCNIGKTTTALHLVKFLNKFLLQDGSLLQCKKSAYCFASH